MAAATPTGALVALHHVSFRFDDGFTLFDSLDLVVDRTPPGIVGRNGVGKSLLAQLIAGRRAPTSGTLERRTTAVYAAPGDVRTVAETAALDAPLAPTHTMQWHRDGWRYEPVAQPAISVIRPPARRGNRRTAA